MIQQALPHEPWSGMLQFGTLSGSSLQVVSLPWALAAKIASSESNFDIVGVGVAPSAALSL